MRVWVLMVGVDVCLGAHGGCGCVFGGGGRRGMRSMQLSGDGLARLDCRVGAIGLSGWRGAKELYIVIDSSVP